MISEHRVKKPENVLVLTVLLGAILAILFWICIVVNDIQRDLKEIHNTLDIMEEMFEQDAS
jgi:hypothetical protein